MPDIQIQIHPVILQIIDAYYKFGMWQQDNATWYRKVARFMVFVLGSVGFTTALIGGSLIADDYNESLYLLTAGIIVAVLIFKTHLNYLKGSQILAVLHAICLHSAPNSDQLLHEVNRKLNIFKKFATFFLGIILVILFTFLALYCPLLTSNKKLPFNIWFPFDWKNSSLAHWLAYSYIIFCLTFNSFICLLTIIIWYIMLNCSIKYQILGQRFKNLGTVTSGKSGQCCFLDKLVELIVVHRKIEENIDSMKSLLSNLFFAQIGTSALCICGSVYAATLNRSQSIDQLLINLSLSLYCIFDIFMLAYFGNEMKELRNRLSYCLFECNWMDQTKICKENVLILAELLNKPREITIGKLYPLNLQTFTAILRGAYSMLNILRNI